VAARTLQHVARWQLEDQSGTATCEELTDEAICPQAHTSRAPTQLHGVFSENLQYRGRHPGFSPVATPHGKDPGLSAFGWVRQNLKVNHPD